MDKLIKQIAEDQNWNKWVEVNSSETTGCISAPKNGCISIAKQGYISITSHQAMTKVGCIS